MVPAASLPGEPIRMRSVFQKEAVCRREGRRMTAKCGLEEGKSLEPAKGQRRIAPESHLREEVKD